MTAIELLADVSQRNAELLKTILSDFSDADMLVRPVPGANHAAWQLGHLINSETQSLNAIKPGTAPPLPADFPAKFTKETSRNDDPKCFPKKSELIECFSKVRAAMVQWVKGLKDSDLQQPAPERIRQWAPTVGHFIVLTPTHDMMHTGQFQVIRRKLGKPVMF